MLPNDARVSIEPERVGMIPERRIPVRRRNEPEDLRLLWDVDATQAHWFGVRTEDAHDGRVVSQALFDRGVGQMRVVAQSLPERPILQQPPYDVGHEQRRRVDATHEQQEGEQDEVVVGKRSARGMLGCDERREEVMRKYLDELPAQKHSLLMKHSRC